MYYIFIYVKLTLWISLCLNQFHFKNKIIKPPSHSHCCLLLMSFHSVVRLGNPLNALQSLGCCTRVERCGVFLFLFWMSGLPLLATSLTSRVRRGRGLTRESQRKGNQPCSWVACHFLLRSLQVFKDSQRRRRRGLVQRSVWAARLDTVPLTPGSSGTWNPAPPHTMRDGLAQKSMPVGNVQRTPHDAALGEGCSSLVA